MKVLVDSVDNEGLEAFIGKPICIFCMSYIYAGILVGVNASCVKLSEAVIVYETGPFNESGWKDAQPLPGDCHYIQTSSIESFGGVK